MAYCLQQSSSRLQCNHRGLVMPFGKRFTISMEGSSKKKEEKMVKHNISHLNEKMEDYSRKEVHYNSSFHAAMDSRVQ